MNSTLRDRRWNIIGQIVCGTLIAILFLIVLYYFIKLANITHVVTFALVLFMIILLVVIGTLLALGGIDELLSPPPDDKGDT